MKLPYMAIQTKQPVPSLGGLHVRYRPVVAIMLTGAPFSQLRDGLLDTGADDTVFSEAVALALGIDLTMAQERSIVLAGRPQPVVCRYASVVLRLSDGVATYEWPATVGFVAAKLHYALLGQAGCLQYFHADFDAEGHVVTLSPNPSFPGTQIVN